jgi:phosphomannomutase
VVDAAALQRIVKAYDVRGLVDTELTPDVAQALGSAAAIELSAPGGRFIVGRDMRPSSPGLVAAFTEGLLAAGVDVIDIGLISTDGLTFASGELDAPGAMFTASHNPAAYNGIKLCRAGAVPVAIDSGLARMRDLAVTILAGGAPGAQGPGRSDPPVRTVARGRRTEQQFLPRFAEHVQGFLDEPDRLRAMRVVVDAGNGMGGLVWPAVAEGLGLETIPLYFELDGTFPNHPADPLDPANLVDLSERVVAEQAALGLAFDGDADRMFAVDASGRPVDSSLVGAVVATRVLGRESGATVLHNLICSRNVPEAVIEAGGVPVRTRVGHSFIKAEMARTGAVLGVEHSGHFYFRDNHRADSGVIAAMMLLEAVAEAGGSLADAVAPHDTRVRSGERNLAVADPVAAVGHAQEAFSRHPHDLLDGLTVDLGDSWFNLRPSNTEPLLRLNVEADTAEQVGSLVREVLASLASVSDEMVPGGSGGPNDDVPDGKRRG